MSEVVETPKRIEPETIYTKADLCRIFDVTPRCIEKRIKRRQFPAPKYAGRDPYWLGERLLAWMKK